MVISDKHNYLFIAIPKTGTRSIYRLLIDEFDGELKRDHSKSIDAKYLDHYSFTVIRNPYDRLVSVWWSTCQRGDDSKRYINKFLKDDISFLNFCKNLENLNSIKNVPHCNLQSDWLESTKFDNVIKFENLNASWLNLPFNKDKKIKLGFLNSTIKKASNNPTARKDYLNYLSSEIIELINNFYIKDFKNTGYEMLNPNLWKK